MQAFDAFCYSSSAVRDVKVYATASTSIYLAMLCVAAANEVPDVIRESVLVVMVMEMQLDGVHKSVRTQRTVCICRI